MRLGHLIRFVILAGDSFADDLVRAISVALRGERPGQEACPDTQWYIEGSVQWFRDTIRVRLALVSMDNHIIEAVWHRDYANSCDPGEIAQNAADTFWIGITSAGGAIHVTDRNP